MKQSSYESYPAWIVLSTNLVSLVMYASGAFVMFRAGWFWLIPYALYILWLEFRVLQKSCVNCYYYGKTCAFGKGRLCRLFFKKGSPEQFGKTSITWKDILPDFLVSVIPIVVGVVLLVLNFNWLVLGAVLLLVLLTTIGNMLVRGSLACKYCKQREIGCPAEKLFGKKGGETPQKA